MKTLTPTDAEHEHLKLGTRFGTRRLAGIAAVLSFGLVGCGNTGESTTDADATHDASTPNAESGQSDAGSEDEAGSAASLVPEEFRERTVQIVTGADYPPYHYLNEDNELAGFNPALAEAIASELGVEHELTSVPQVETIPGMQAERYDFSVSSFNMTPERMEVLDFVTYLQDPTAYMTNSSTDIAIDSEEAICGLTMGASVGTAQAAVLEEIDADCQAAGNEPVEIQTFQSNTAATTALQSNRVDGISAAYSQLSYTVEVSGDTFLLAEYVGENEPISIGFVKGHPLAEAILQAVKDIQADGTYDAILEQNNVSGMAYLEPKIVTGDNENGWWRAVPPWRGRRAPPAR